MAGAVGSTLAIRSTGVNTALDQVVGLAELSVGDTVIIEVIEQTQGAIDDMGDFKGW